MKTGVFLCTCGSTVDIDFKILKKSITADVVEVDDLMCSDEGLARITDTFKRYRLDKALVACTARRHIFEQTGLNLLFVNLREQCGWVHERKEATEKAKVLVNTALHSPPLPGKVVIDAGKEVFITGELSASLRIGQHLSRAGNVYVLVSRTDGCYPATLPEMHGGVRIFAGYVRDIEGRIGDFRVNIIANAIDLQRCISCGRCLEACAAHAIHHYPVFATGKECNSCGKCLQVCPVHAIDLKETVKTIKTGQILFIGDENGEFRGFERKKGIYVTAAGKTNEETYRQALSSAMEILLSMGRAEQDKLLAVSLEGCACGKSGIKGCSLCENACQHSAISRSGDRIMFDELSCTGCGACASACPLSLPQTLNDVYSEMEHLLTGSELNPGILMIACNEWIPLLDTAGRRRMKYPAVLPLFIPCIKGVSESHVLRAFDLGADGVVLLGCRECGGYGGSLKLASLIMADFAPGDRICFITNYNTDSLIKSMAVFSEHLTPSPLREHEPLIFKSSANRRRMVELVAGFAAKTGINPQGKSEGAAYPFAEIRIDSKCTVCGACTAMCPAGALLREGDSIKFVYGYCIACGLCEKACPEEALKIQRVLDMQRLTDTSPSILFKSEMLICASCKKPYMTAAAFDRITGLLITNVRNDIKPQEQVELIKSQMELLKYCGECRPARAIEKMELF